MDSVGNDEASKESKDLILLVNLQGSQYMDGVMRQVESIRRDIPQCLC